MSSLPQHTGHYYYVSHPGANHKTHYTANSKCAQFGGYLVEINNKGEYDFAVSILKSMHKYESTKYEWIKDYKFAMIGEVTNVEDSAPEKKN